MSQFCKGLDNSGEIEFLPTHVTTKELTFWKESSPGLGILRDDTLWKRVPVNTLVLLKENDKDAKIAMDIDGYSLILYNEEIPGCLREI